MSASVWIAEVGRIRKLESWGNLLSQADADAEVGGGGGIGGEGVVTEGVA